MIGLHLEGTWDKGVVPRQTFHRIVHGSGTDDHLVVGASCHKSGCLNSVHASAVRREGEGLVRFEKHGIHELSLAGSCRASHQIVKGAPAAVGRQLFLDVGHVNAKFKAISWFNFCQVFLDCRNQHDEVIANWRLLHENSRLAGQDAPMACTKWIIDFELFNISCLWWS